MSKSIRGLIDYEFIHDDSVVDKTGFIKRLMTRIYNGLELIAIEREEYKDMNFVKRLRKQTIKDELMDAGLNYFDLAHPEARKLVSFLQPDEHVQAAIRGRISKTGSVLIAATNLRILYLQILPLLSNVEEFPYGLVSGVQCTSIQGLWSSVILQTRAQTFEVDFVSPRAARKFIEFIEKTAIDNPRLPVKPVAMIA